MRMIVCNNCRSVVDPTQYFRIKDSPTTVHMCFSCLACAFTNLVECTSWDEAVLETKDLFKKWGVQPYGKETSIH